MLSLGVEGVELEGSTIASMVDTRHETSLACGSEGEGSKRACDDHVLHFDTRPSTAHAASRGVEALSQRPPKSDVKTDDLFFEPGSVHVDVAPSISIADLKDSVASKCGVDVAEMDLTYGGEVLETNKTLNDCVGSSGRTLQLVPRPARATVHVEMNPIRATEDSAIETPKKILNI